MGTITETPATTATADEEQLVTPKPRTVLFMSRRTELRLTKVPRYPIRGASGQQVGESQGEVVNFRDGRCDVDPEGDFELEDGRKVPGADILAWLAQHKRNGDVNEGFWQVDHLAPSPTTVEMEQLVKAATELDAEKLEELIAQEEQGWNRSAILEVARGARDRVLSMRAAATAAPETPVAPDPVEQAQAERAAAVPPAPAVDEEALAAQYGISVEELRARLAGPQA